MSDNTTQSDDLFATQQNDLFVSTDEFIDYKQFVASQMDAFYAQISDCKGSNPINHTVDNNFLQTKSYEAEYIKALHSRIESLEKQLDMKQNTVDTLLNSRVSNNSKSKQINLNSKQHLQTLDPKSRDTSDSGDKNIPPLNKNKHTIQKQVNMKQQPTQRKCFIVSDSMTGGIVESKLCSPEINVRVRAQGGATSVDLVDYVKPIVRKQPDFLLVHGSTNDIGNNMKKNSDKIDTISNFEEILKIVKETSPNTKLVFSSCITRADRKDVDKHVHEMNNKLKIFCQHNQLDFIDNGNINKGDLGNKKLHLKKPGTLKLAGNFRNYLSSV